MSETPPTLTVTIDPRQRINAPSIALLVTGIIGGALTMLIILLNLLGFGLGALAADRGASDAVGMLYSGTFGVAFGLMGLVVAGFIIFAAMKMRSLESWGMSVAAAIVAMIPCISPCCLLGIPVGIWCLVLLFDASVKEAFTS
jgi:predicted lysophospholipase L1 biosynthesis ABC-type transport system permease subunit